MPPHHTFWRSILILFSHRRLGLPSGLFPSSLPTKTLCYPIFVPHAHVDLINQIIFVYQISSHLCAASAVPSTSPSPYEMFSSVVRFYVEQFSAPRTTPKLAGPQLVRCLRLFVQCIRSCLPYLEAFPALATWGTPVLCRHWPTRNRCLKLSGCK